MNQVFSRLKAGFARRWYAPAIELRPMSGLIRLGSHDCGLTVMPSIDLDGATIVTAGLGEDASFDVEMISRFGCKAIAVDPTPRSIAYFEKLEAQFGNERSCPYEKHGPQPVEAYDLKSVKRGDMVLERSALWCENTELKFFAPPREDFVSHSITNIQNNYSNDTPHIIVPAITVRELLARHNLATIPLLKFDIEGAECKVIPQMFGDGIFPRQILMEYDEMLCPSARSQVATEATHRALTEAFYTARHATPEGNFLYIRDS